MKVLDLFSGIGGFSYGLESTGGFETVAFAECEPYPIAVLKKHWPTVRVYEDVRQITATRLFRDGIEPDVITGGFPCQDISTAGQQAGIEGERSGLWSECARILGEVRPRYAIFENVTNLLSGNEGKWFERVLWDISGVGYDAEWHCISASSIGAPHKRDRVWIVAYPKGNSKPICPINAGALQKASLHPDPCSARSSIRLSRSLQWKERDTRKPFNSHHQHGRWSPKNHWTVEPSMGRVANGIPRRVAKLKALGNSIVPQIAYLIGQEILNYEESLCQQQ